VLIFLSIKDDLVQRLRDTFDRAEIDQIVRSLIDQDRIVRAEYRTAAGTSSVETSFFFVAGDVRWYSR
jgi:hypothetical protein